MRPLGDWDALPDGFKFQSGGVGEDFIDLVSVKSEGALLWWNCKRSHAKTKDTRPNVNAPFWELGQNLKFVATDLLLAKEAVIEGNILASSMSYKLEEKEEGGEIEGGMIIQGGEYVLPKLRDGEVREIRVLPKFVKNRGLATTTQIRMPYDDDGYIWLKPKGREIYDVAARVRALELTDEKDYITLLGVG